jgi:hypothetical protein
VLVGLVNSSIVRSAASTAQCALLMLFVSANACRKGLTMTTILHKTGRATALTQEQLLSSVRQTAVPTAASLLLRLLLLSMGSAAAPAEQSTFHLATVT